MRSLIAIAALVVGCTESMTVADSEPAPEAHEDAGHDAGWENPVRDAGEEDASAPVEKDAGQRMAADPFAPQPDESEGLTNVSADLEALLENGDLEGACAAYEADPSDRRAMLLCGKWMFFYETFGTGGVPAPIVDFLIESFPNEVGPGFSAMGMVPDPYSDANRPLGFTPGAPLGSVETVVYTCAACHFGQLPDGRYAVGAPNHRFEYGKQILAIALLPRTVDPRDDPASHHPRALAAIQPMIDKLESDGGLRLRLLIDLLPLLGSGGSAQQPAFTPEIEGQYASWPPGTMDFVITPLPLDDGVHTVSKIIPLWGLPRAQEQVEAGMPHAMLAWTGGAQSLEDFLGGFVAIGGGPQDTWPPERLLPLAEYIYSLRAPDNAAPADDALVQRGREIFSDRCLGCHGAPRGGGDRIHTFEEIGTDDAMKAWGDPELEGRLCCGLGDGTTPATHGIKSPRLTGLWSFERFLHNGAVAGIEALFCLDEPRPVNMDHALGTEGHDDLCEDFTRDDKLALIAFLERV